MAYRHHPGVYDPKFKTNSRRRELQDLMSEWYGSNFAAQEIVKRTNEARPLTEILDDILEKNLNKNSMQILELQENWAKIIGPPLNTYTSLAAIKENKAFVEVKHPAFLVELRRPGTADNFLTKLKKAAPGLEISQMVFVPAGQYRSDEE